MDLVQSSTTSRHSKYRDVYEYLDSLVIDTPCVERPVPGWAQGMVHGFSEQHAMLLLQQHEDAAACVTRVGQALAGIRGRDVDNHDHLHLHVVLNSDLTLSQ